MKDSFPLVYVLLLNWNGKDLTIECVDSLLKSNYPNYKILIVDNGSIDDSVKVFKQKYSDVEIIQNKKNLGYAKGFNVGLKAAYERESDYFLVMNNDTVIDSNAITELVKVAKNDESIGIVTGKVLYYDKPNVIQRAGKETGKYFLPGKHIGAGEIDNGQCDFIKEFDFVDDVFWLLSRKLYKKVGGYDPTFFNSSEEADLCIRARKENFKIFYTYKAKLWHKDSASMGGGGSPRIVYYDTRNRIPLVYKNYNKRVFLQFYFSYLLSICIASAKSILKLKFKKSYALIRGVLSGSWWIIHKGEGKYVKI